MLMGKSLSLTILGSCAALAFSNATAQFAPGQPNPASGATQATKRSDAGRYGYPQFSYPSSPVARQASPRAAVPALQRRPQAGDPTWGGSDPYSYDGWNNNPYDPPSQDGPSLNEPWTVHGPADQPGPAQ